MRSAALLAWYDRHRRVLPWRAVPGSRADPYHVWLSEIMLQQTTVTAVEGYFRRFVGLWPDVHALAAAPLDAVLTAWAGLGYYARARNLHRCARIVSRELAGRFPEDESGLRALPGIGAYTAGAIAAIAFGRKAAAIDGNVERVVARLFAIADPLPRAKPAIRAAAAAIVPGERPGDFAQAMMDLGATVCTPRRPRCMICPLGDGCAARKAGMAEALPRVAAKPERPLRRGTAFWVERPDGAVLLRRRPESGLLGGMIEVPSTPWSEGAGTDPIAHAPLATTWTPLAGVVRHGFTHFRLELTVWRGRAEGEVLAGAIWAPVDGLGDYALPTAMRKIVGHALSAPPA